MNREQLIELRDIFALEKDWEEVGKLQYQIDLLPKPKPKQEKLSPWIITCYKMSFLENLLKVVKKDIALLTYLKKREDQEKEK